MVFRTEKEYEPLLQLETRTVQSRHGYSFKITMFKMYWNSFDLLGKVFSDNERVLVQLAEGYARIDRTSIHTTFPEQVWNVHAVCQKKYGYTKFPLPVPPQPLRVVNQMVRW